ncbi:MAG: ATP-binding protein [Polyangiales bacterium]
MRPDDPDSTAGDGTRGAVDPRVTPSPEALLVVDLDARVVSANDAARHALGYAGDALTRMSLGDLDARLRPASWSERLVALRRHGALAFDADLRTGAGATLAVTLTASLVALGAEARVAVTVRERSAGYEAEVTAARNQLAATLDAIPDLLFEVDLDGRYLACHAPRAALLAAPAEQLLGRTIADVLSPAASEACMAALREAHERGHSLGRQLELALEHGRMWFELSVSRKAVPHGASPRFIVLSRDITVRKRAEEALRASEVQLRSILGSTVDGILAVDRAGRVVRTNRRFAELWRIPASIVERGDDEALLRFVVDQLADPEAFLRKVESLYQSDEELTDTVRFTDGRLFERFTAPLLLNGENVGRIWSFRDVTARDEAERAHVAARVAAEAANRAKSEFLANMSHELRTPLNGVLGNIQLLEMTALDAEQREYVSAVTASGRNLLSLINDILDLSKIEADKLVLDASPFSLRACVDGAVAMQRARAREKSLTLTAVMPDDVPEALLGDELRIRQILLNLVGNAVKFTHAGEVTVSVAVLERVGDAVRVELCVADTGIGIAPALVGDIFKPFVQADTSITRRYGGTGLGLAICARLTERMGGSIAVESVEGVGSTFRVSLPLTALPSDAASAQSPPQPIEALWADAPRKVLLVEDNPVSRRLGVVLLTKMRHEVTAVEHGRAALDALVRERFDLVLMDIQMPVMDGTAAIAELRERERETAAHTPVIAVTACASKDEERALLGAGFDGYVRKPLGVRELVEQMRHALRNRRDGDEALSPTPRRG